MNKLIRHSVFKPYAVGPTFHLYLYDIGKTDIMNKSILGYKLVMHENKTRTTIFDNKDFACSPLYGVDSDGAVRSLMTFLTLRPGDTDSEYFNNYNSTQLDFCNKHAESLGLEVLHRYGE